MNNNNTVTAYGDLTLTKTDGTATVTAGTSTTYTITITNNGPSTEPAGVRFTDTIPAGTVGSETEADCAIAAGGLHVHDGRDDRVGRVQVVSADARRPVGVRARPRS